jgi:hypothetical protein
MEEFFFFLVAVTGVSTQGLVLAQLALYHLNQASSPFCFGYFGDRVLFFMPRRLNLDLPILLFPPLLEKQAHTTIPSFFCQDGNLTDSLPPAPTGLEPQSSPSQSPKSLGLQA